jgi:DNA polymerase III delta prime subunit
MLNSKQNWTNYKGALNSLGDVYLAQDLTEKGVKHYNALSIKDTMALSQDDRNMYEILKEDRPHKMYLDIDCKYNSVKKFFKANDTDDTIKNDITDALESMIEDFQEYYFSDHDHWDVNILDSSNKLKFSFHFCVDIKLKNFEESQAFHKRFLAYIKDNCDEEDFFEMPQHVDKCVYTKNRLIRLINQSKFGQDRPLKIYKGSDEPLDHLITYFNKKTRLIELPKGWLQGQNKVNSNLAKLKTKLPQERDYNTDDELKWLVEHTVHMTDKYDDWIKWVWACLGAGISVEMIHELSQEGAHDKYDESGTDKIIKQFVKEKSNLGIHSLRFWAKENGHEIQREVEIKAKPLPTKKENHLTWIDLVKKYHHKIFDSQSQMIYAIRDDVSQVISMIQGKDTIFTIYANNDEPYAISMKLCNLKLMYRVKSLKGDESTCDITLQKLMIEHPNDFPLYNKLVFKPRDHKLKRLERNTFSGFEAQKYDSHPIYNDNLNQVPNNLRPLLFHIKNVLANGDEKIYSYIMSWFAQVIKTPWKPTDIFMLFQGNQGSGKTMMSDFLVKHIFGRHLSVSTSGIKSLTQRFNGAVRGKLFICCNELTTIESGKGAFNSAFDTMKNLITDRLIQIEHKGLEHIQIDNLCNFMGTTNHMFTAKLEKGDRRYACFQVNNEYVGNWDYFNKLGDSLNQETGDMFYTYLFNYPKEKMLDLRKIPQTQLREQLINNSKNNVEQFVDELMEDFVDVDDRQWIDKEEMKISSQALYQVYLNWSAKNGEMTCSNNVFMRKIPKEFIKDAGRVILNKKRIRWIKFK